MEVILYVKDEFSITAEITFSSKIIENPKIKAPNGKPIPSSLQENLAHVENVLARRNYIELLMTFIEFGLSVKGIFITSFYTGRGNGVIYGVTPDNSLVELLSKQKREDIFETIDPVDLNVAKVYADSYSNGTVNMRDCLGMFPLYMTVETRDALAQLEGELTTRQMLNFWVNNRAMVEPVETYFKIEDMIKTLDSVIGADSVFGACWQNKEGYTDVTTIPVIQQKVFRGIDPAHLSYYLYLLNLILTKQDDTVVSDQLAIVRFLLAHPTLQ